MTHQIKYGQFNTISNQWMTRPVRAFIGSPKAVVDPFAGRGDLLNHFEGSIKIGYDIDPTFQWIINDGLVSIPKHRDAICLTNPLYMSKASATKKGFGYGLYFAVHPDCSDLYQIALKNCLASYDKVVAIVPESFLLSGKLRDRLVFVDVIESNLFENTTCPVLVACFGPESAKGFKVYKNGVLVGTFGELAEMARFEVDASMDFRFNDTSGKIGLVTSDGSDPSARIRFCSARDPSLGSVKASCRTHTLISVRSNVRPSELIKEANEVLAEIREDCRDVLLEQNPITLHRNLRR